ncbi:MAG: ribonuclease HII [Hyphomicrobiales bacterium]
MKADSKKPDFSLETAALSRGFQRVAGVDEAGCGPWAGPVVAGAVVLDARNKPAGLNDSKKLNEARREQLFEQILATADVGIGIVDVARIDELNILKATLAAMSEAVNALSVGPEFVLIDGNRCPELSCPTEAIVKGDSVSESIAAASIVAKVTRDRIMRDAAETFPEYGFERHKGYGTAQHQEALRKLGPCPLHRSSFAPIRALLVMEH